MKRFFVNLSIFLLLPLPLLFSLAYIVDSGLRKSRSFYYAEWNDLMQGKINADWLICGSSRAWVHVSPRIMDSALHANSYNIGLDGTKCAMQCDRFYVYLKYNKAPKYVIHTVDFTTFAENNELFCSQQFLPYLYDSSIRELTSHYKGRFNIADYYFPLYKYNNQMPIVAEGIRCFFNKGIPGTKYKGYQAQNKPWDNTFDDFIKSNPTGSELLIDSASVNKMEQYLLYCQQHNIKVILVFPPVYREYLKYCRNKDAIIAVYKNFEHKGLAAFLNYVDDELAADKNNFYNSQHMNGAAAERFSRKLAGDLIQLTAAGNTGRQP